MVFLDVSFIILSSHVTFLAELTEVVDAADAAVLN